MLNVGRCFCFTIECHGIAAITKPAAIDKHHDWDQIQSFEQMVLGNKYVEIQTVFLAV